MVGIVKHEAFGFAVGKASVPDGGRFQLSQMPDLVVLLQSYVPTDVCVDFGTASSPCILGDVMMILVLLKPVLVTLPPQLSKNHEYTLVL